MHENVTIIGDGQMGLVLADALIYRGVEVRLWGPFPENLDELRQSRRSGRLPGFDLAPDVRCEPCEDAALAGATLVVNAIPTQFIRRVWCRLAPHLPEGIPIVSVSKGIENETLALPSRILIESIGQNDPQKAHDEVVLSGPTIARELAERRPATMVAAAQDPALAERVQELFNVPWLRVYGSDDPLGVEVAGATKNVIALAAGMVDGLEAGDNAKSALLARGLAEIARLGAALGAKVDTFFGIAGVGDLATTCFSPLGRNRTCGERLGRGESLDEILGDSLSVIEGVPTTQSVHQLSQQFGVDMPIAHAVNEILFGDLAPREAIQRLMSRELKPERIG